MTRASDQLGTGTASLLIVSFSLGEAAQSVKLALDPNSEPNIAGYVLRYGTIEALSNH